MLTREQAIMIINQYATKEGTFVFHFSFPSSKISTDLDTTSGLYHSKLEIKKDELSYDIQQIIYNHLLKSKIVARRNNYIEFRNNEHITHLLDTIKFLENYQNQYDEMEKKDNVELNDMVNVINKIRKFEYKLIDEAEILLQIKEDIETCVVDWGKKLSNKNNW